MNGGLIPKGISRWNWIPAAALALLLLYFAFRGVDWSEVLATISRARPGPLLLAALLISVSYYLRALRWRVLLSAERLVPVKTVFWATVAGYLGNAVLPARAGELIRTVLLGRRTGIGESYVLATVLTERILDAIALLIIALVALASLPSLPEWLLVATRVMAGIGVAGVIGLFVLSRLDGFVDRLMTLLPVPEGLRARIANIVRRFMFGLRAFQHPGRATRFSAYTVVVWLVDGIISTQIASALGLEMNLLEALLLLSALGLASAAAPSTPGFVGIYQFVAVSVLVPLGFSQSDALAFIISLQATIYIVVIPWGLLGLWQLGLRRPSDVVQVAEIPGG